MSASPIITAALIEHGADPTQPDGLAWILRGEAGRSALPAVTTDAEYVRAVRRILRRASRYTEAQEVLDAAAPLFHQCSGPGCCSVPVDAPTAGSVDWRLLVCGWHLRLAPSVWVARLPSFLRYWQRSAHVPRPVVVGSSHNADPLDVARAWALRLPAHGGPLAILVATMAPDTGARRVTTDRRKLVDAARALARSSVRCGYSTLGRGWGSWASRRLSISALAALGRLTPQLQAAAIERMMADDPHPDGVVCRETCVYAPRIGRSAIPWEHIAAERARGERYLAARYLRGRALCAALGVEAIDPSSPPDAAPSLSDAQEREWAARPPELVAALVPGWATGPHVGCVSVRVALRLARGDSVATVAADLLDAVGVVVDVHMTRAEEHAVVAGALASDGGARAHLARHLGAPAPTWGLIQSVAAMRWFAAVSRDPARREALWRERVAYIPGHLVAGPLARQMMVDGHAVVRMRYVAHLDEVRAADLPDGPRTGVERAMRAAAERATREAMVDAPQSDRSLSPTPRWWQPAPGVRLLDSARSLWIEGDEMRHCVAGYAGAVQSGRSVIVGLQAPDGTRSTVELDRESQVVRQHHGWRNGQPSGTCETLLRSMLVAWRGWS